MFFYFLIKKVESHMIYRYWKTQLHIIEEWLNLKNFKWQNKIEGFI